jgi:hypothetical protein
MPELVAGENSYCTLAEANDYHDSRIHTATWFCTADSDKEKALIIATQLLDTYDYNGCKSNSSQSLQFPRYDMGDQIPDGTPDAMKHAVAELAHSLITADIAEREGRNVKRTKADSVEVEFFGGGGGYSVDLPVMVKRLINRFIVSGTKLVRA